MQRTALFTARDVSGLLHAVHVFTLFVSPCLSGGEDVEAGTLLFTTDSDAVVLSAPARS